MASILVDFGGRGSFDYSFEKVLAKIVVCLLYTSDAADE